NDAVNRTFVRPFTGGSRLIQKGLLSPGEVLTLSVSCIVLGIFASVWLAFEVGREVLALGAAGIIGGFFYIAPPVRFGHRGMGEAIVALDFGILPVAGAYFVQTGRWSVESLILSVPVAVLIAGVLFINEFQDREADAAVGKRTWVVRLGLRRAAKVHALLMIGWPTPIFVAVLAGALHPATLMSLPALLVSIPAAAVVMRCYKELDKLTAVNILTIMTHLLATLLLSAGLFFGA
ncbi:MAG: prenyltransferase, partial [Verrucomicrobiota bacterium]